MTTDPEPRRSALVGPAAVVAIAASVTDLAILAAFHLLQPDVDPLTSPTSSYVHGTAGFASHVGTLAAGVGALALAVALGPFRSSRRDLAGLGLLVIFGLAKVAQAFFPIDPEGVTTGAGTAHNLLGNLAFFTLPVAAVLLGRLVSRVSRRSAAGPLGWILVVTTVGVLLGDAAGVFGLAQRVYLVTAAVWVAAVSLVVAVRVAPAARGRG